MPIHLTNYHICPGLGWIYISRSCYQVLFKAKKIRWKKFLRLVIKIETSIPICDPFLIYYVVKRSDSSWKKKPNASHLKKKKRVITRTTPLLKEWPSSIKNVSSYVYIAIGFFSAGNFIFIYALINQDNMIHLQINVILNNFSNVFTNYP